jgi:hypothetical protein
MTKFIVVNVLVSGPSQEMLPKTAGAVLNVSLIQRIYADGEGSKIYFGERDVIRVLDDFASLARALAHLQTEYR